VRLWKAAAAALDHADLLAVVDIVLLIWSILLRAHLCGSIVDELGGFRNIILPRARLFRLPWVTHWLRS
jgi:hypothetical protein